MVRLWKVIAALLVLNLLDMWTTWQAIAGTGDFIELNPTFLGNLVRAGQWPLAFAMKLMLVAWMAGILHVLRRRRSRLLPFACQGAVGVFVAVVFWNSTQLILKTWPWIT
jgi:hypothetical protein